ncbi:MAG: hypothetical protein JKY43_01925 [Phycisphaerales bacterium]|nr:hypothetical protein [Phycisphaerales bacterium]
MSQFTNPQICHTPHVARRPAVLIIESLKPREMAKEWTEARATADVLKTLGVDSLYHQARGQEDLRTGARIFASGQFDVLHLACHGCDTAIQLTDGTMMNWNELATDLGHAVQGKQLVLSACHGGCANVPKLFAASQYQPRAIIGPSCEIHWADLVVAWQVYYKSVLSTTRQPDHPCVAVSRVKMATDADLICYQWKQEKGDYEVFKPSYGCAWEVIYRSFKAEIDAMQASIDNNSTGSQQGDGAITDTEGNQNNVSKTT